MNSFTGKLAQLFAFSALTHVCKGALLGLALTYNRVAVAAFASGLVLSKLLARFSQMVWLFLAASAKCFHAGGASASVKRHMDGGLFGLYLS